MQIVNLRIEVSPKAAPDTKNFTDIHELHQQEVFMGNLTQNQTISESEKGFQMSTMWPNLSQIKPEPMPSTFTSSSLTGCPTVLVPKVCTFWTDTTDLVAFCNFQVPEPWLMMWIVNNLKIINTCTLNTVCIQVLPQINMMVALEIP